MDRELICKFAVLFPLVVRSAIVATIGVGAVLCLTQCAAEQGDGENIASVSQALEQCGGVACEGNSDCLSVSVMPLCASSGGATCLQTSPRECAWKLNI